MIKNGYSDLYCFKEISDLTDYQSLWKTVSSSRWGSMIKFRPDRASGGIQGFTKQTDNW